MMEIRIKPELYIPHIALTSLCFYALSLFLLYYYYREDTTIHFCSFDQLSSRLRTYKSVYCVIQLDMMWISLDVRMSSLLTARIPLISSFVYLTHPRG